MKTELHRTHITDDMGNDVTTDPQLDKEFDALCEVAEAADQVHREHCLLLTANCPLCKALATLDLIRQSQYRASHN